MDAGTADHSIGNIAASPIVEGQPFEDKVRVMVCIAEGVDDPAGTSCPGTSSVSLSQVEDVSEIGAPWFI